MWQTGSGKRPGLKAAWGGGRDGAEKVIFKLYQQAKIVLGRVSLGVEIGIGNLGVLRDHDKSSVCVERTVLVLQKLGRT